MKISVYSEIILKLFYECTVLLSCLEVALNTYFKSCKQGILLKTFFRLIDYYIPKKYFMFLRIFKRQGRRGNKITAGGGLKNVKL